MKRDLMRSLQAWKCSPRRKPLLLRGARQVGKSWLVRSLGESFEHFIEINFEKHEQAHAFFEGDFVIADILQKIRLFFKMPLVPGKTLLFFDEIQACERCIIALRYFKEEYPELHVIAAGSLVDFALENTGMPVGRVQYLYLHPLSFGEFLTAQGLDELRQYINTKNIDSVFHKQLLEHVKTYCWLGGLPEAVTTWVETKDVDACHAVHDELIYSYKQDFHKYAKSYQIEKIDVVFKAIPKQLGNKFVYKKVDSNFRSNVLSEALYALQKAGIAHIVCHSSAQGHPLGASINGKRFKVFFFDIGLAQRLLGMNAEQFLLAPLSNHYVGGVAEQYVAQQYIALTATKTEPELYYWHREARTSNAEIDFLFIKNNDIVPVEVKSGSKGTLKSLALFLESHQYSQYGIKISEQPFAHNGDLFEIPFYGIAAWLAGQ